MKRQKMTGRLRTAMLMLIVLTLLTSCALFTDTTGGRQPSVKQGNSTNGAAAEGQVTGGEQLIVQTGIAAEAEDEKAMYDSINSCAGVDGMMRGVLPMFAPEKPDNYGFVPEQEFNTEEYDHIQENRFLSVAANPWSTFAADVDTASYSNIRRYILQDSMLPPPDAVRIEEMINAFSYNYQEPEKGHPLSLTMELTDTPWNPQTKLLSLGLQAEKIDNSKRQAANLVFLIDVSGSMDEPNKLPLVKKAFQLLAENLSASDRISIVTYAGSDAVLAEGVSGTERERIMDEIENLMAGGGTHGSAGIETAYKIAEKYFIRGGSNRVILATDGDLNIGVTNEGDLVRLIEEKKKSGVFLTVLGFGEGNIKDNKMEALANHGDGQYAYIDDVFEARRVLVDELGAQLNLIAKDVKIQLEFNPALIKGYRLIGYENRLMAAEDFADDTKDGGEMGSGHRVTALYEIVLKDSPMEIEHPERRYKKAATPSETSSVAEDELLCLSIRYKAPDGDESKLESFPLRKDAYQADISDNSRLAAAVAAFGMILRESSYLNDYGYEDILVSLRSLQEGGKSIDELLYLVGRAENLAPKASQKKGGGD